MMKIKEISGQVVAGSPPIEIGVCYTKRAEARCQLPDGLFNTRNVIP